MRYRTVNELGLKRQSNQDRVLALETKHGFLGLVCDGIGGGRAGDVASQLVVETFRDEFSKVESLMDDESVIHWFGSTLHLANQYVFLKSMSNSEYNGMGTTIIGVLIRGERAIGFNVGDSRLYEYRHAKLNQLSTDQTYAYQMYLENEITKEEVETHPRRNVLINAVGIKDTIEFETIRVIDGWDRLMLSSDGLHDFVPHGYIEQAFTLNIDQCSDILKDLAYEAGGLDNISFVIVEDGVNE